jgi:hypothetical protein
MIKFTLQLFLISALLITSCSSKKIKEKINKTGDVAGQAIGEFTTGVTTGVEKAIEPNVELSHELLKNGITSGKIIISSDSGASDNILTAYLVFDKDFNQNLTAKAFDSKGIEMGRVKIPVQGKKAEASYFEFKFDKRTNIDNDSKIIIE